MRVLADAFKCLRLPLHVASGFISARDQRVAKRNVNRLKRTAEVAIPEALPVSPAYCPVIPAILFETPANPLNGEDFSVLGLDICVGATVTVSSSPFPAVFPASPTNCPILPAFDLAGSMSDVVARDLRATLLRLQNAFDDRRRVVAKKPMYTPILKKPRMFFALPAVAVKITPS